MSRSARWRFRQRRRSEEPEHLEAIRPFIEDLLADLRQRVLQDVVDCGGALTARFPEAVEAQNGVFDGGAHCCISRAASQRVRRACARRAP